MSRPDETAVICSSCGHEQRFVVWQSVNVSLDPELKGQLLSGKPMEFSCDHCGDKDRVVYPLLYHDMDRGLMIWLFPGDEAPEDASGMPLGIVNRMAETYQFRWVQSCNELLEKIHLADAGFDDRVFELFKVFLRKQWVDQISEADDLLFSGIEGREDERRILLEIVSVEGCGEAELPHSTYEAFTAHTGDDLVRLQGRGEVRVVPVLRADGEHGLDS